jgi:hypothetical protein
MELLLDEATDKRSARKSPVNMRLCSTVHLRTLHCRKRTPDVRCEEYECSYVCVDSIIYAAKRIWHERCHYIMAGISNKIARFPKFETWVVRSSYV